MPHKLVNTITSPTTIVTIISQVFPLSTKQENEQYYYLENELNNCESRMISLTQATGSYRAQIASLATATLNESVANQTRRIAELTVMSNLLIAESTNMSTLRSEINQYKTEIRELRRPPQSQHAPRMPNLTKFDPTREDVDDFFERFLDVMKLHEVTLAKYFEEP
jgi:hypothetical protein